MIESLPTNGHTRPERPPLIPPHIAWPAFVVLLLLMSISAAAVTVYMAHSDGGAQVVDESPYAPNR